MNRKWARSQQLRAVKPSKYLERDENEIETLPFSLEIFNPSRILEYEAFQRLFNTNDRNTSREKQFRFAASLRRFQLRLYSSTHLCIDW